MKLQVLAFKDNPSVLYFNCVLSRTKFIAQNRLNMPDIVLYSCQVKPIPEHKVVDNLPRLNAKMV